MTSLPLASLLTEPVGVPHYLVVGAVLFLMTFAMNASSYWFKRRLRMGA